MHHKSALLMAEMAPENAGKEEVRTLAEGMIKSQKAEIEQMEEWLEEWFA